MKNFFAIGFVITILFALIVFSIPAYAQEETAQSDSLQSPVKVNQNDVKLFIDKINIEGQLEKPQAVFILPGHTPDIDDIQIERSFLKEIFRPVEKRVTVETKYKPDYSNKRKDVIEW